MALSVLCVPFPELMGQRWFCPYLCARSLEAASWPQRAPLDLNGVNIQHWTGCPGFFLLAVVIFTKQTPALNRFFSDNFAPSEHILPSIIWCTTNLTPPGDHPIQKAYTSKTCIYEYVAPSEIVVRSCFHWYTCKKLQLSPSPPFRRQPFALTSASRSKSAV